MPRVIYLTSSLLALTVAVQAQPVKPQTLDASQAQLLSHLTTEWKAYFRSIGTLDMQWQWSSFPFGPEDRQTYNYHFWRAPGRYRLDTAFHSWKSGPAYTKDSTVLGENGAVKALDITFSGYARLMAPYANQEKNPYGSAIPAIEVFGWAMDKESALTLEEFGSDVFWQRFARRVENVEAGQWQGKRGWWLTASSNQNGEATVLEEKLDQRRVRVFIDGTTFFPLLTTGTTRYKTKDFASENAYNIQVTKTQTWVVNGKTRLLPLDFVSRGWRHNLTSGERTTQVTTIKSLAPIKINAAIDGSHWKLAIPAKTLVTYSLRPNPKFTDYRTFIFDPQGGSLWAQQSQQVQRQAAKLQRYRAMPVIYDEKADGEAQITAALEIAKAQNKNVLLQFGAYWCPPCHTLHDLLGHDPILAPLVKDNYVSVPIDLNGGHNEAVSNRLMGKEQGGLPFIVILNAQGQRIAAPPSEYFTPTHSDKAFDIEKVATFLKRWKPQR